MRAHENGWQTISYGYLLALVDAEEQKYFDEDLYRHINPTWMILKMAWEIDTYEQMHLTGWAQQTDTIFIGWKRPNRVR
jgi:hypothetical protein